jgi:hypothetical protein
MWCAIYKWNISRTLDSGKALSGLTKRHLEGCASCREFSRANQDLEKRLSADAAALIGSADPSLAGRMKTRIPAGRSEDSSSLVPSRPRTARLRPVWAAAASLAVVVGVSLIWIVSTPPAKMPSLDPLLRFDGPRAYLETAVQKAESPYQEEIQELKQALESTADYLISRLDVNLGPEN